MKQKRNHSRECGDCGHVYWRQPVGWVCVAGACLSGSKWYPKGALRVSREEQCKTEGGE